MDKGVDLNVWESTAAKHGGGIIGGILIAFLRIKSVYAQSSGPLKIPHYKTISYVFNLSISLTCEAEAQINLCVDFKI